MVKIAPTEMSSLKQQRFSACPQNPKIPPLGDETGRHNCDAGQQRMENRSN
jgi:hypothetical protein